MITTEAQRHREERITLDRRSEDHRFDGLAGVAGPQSGGGGTATNESHEIGSDSFSAVPPPPDAALRAARRIDQLCDSVTLWLRLGSRRFCGLRLFESS